MSYFTSQSMNQPKDNLIINYLPPEMTENDLQTIFEQFGTITQVKIVRNRETKKSVGYGFVKFESESDAENAMRHLNGYRIGKKQIKVSFARPSSDNIKECKLYVSYLPPEYTQQQVINLFSQFGQIIECRLLFDNQTGQSRSTAFVQFNTKQEALNALSLNGTVLENSSRQLLVKFAEDHAGKRTQQQMVLQSNNNNNHQQQQMYFHNMMMGNDEQYQRRSNNQQQQLPFGMSSNDMSWIGIPPYYNFGVTRNDQQISQMNKPTNNEQVPQQFIGQNQFNMRNYP